jgi:hypothetical protein
MGAIKDIVDLCIKLRDENRDGKVSAAISQIQSLTLSLQSEQAAIAEKNLELVTENLDLKRKLLNTETVHAHTMVELQEKHRAEMAKIIASNTRPKGNRLDEATEKILKLFFDAAREISDRQIAQKFQLSMSVAGYHTDKLFEKKFITCNRVVMGDADPMYEITANGREYIVENGLVG